MVPFVSEVAERPPVEWREPSGDSSAVKYLFCLPAFFPFSDSFVGAILSGQSSQS